MKLLKPLLVSLMLLVFCSCSNKQESNSTSNEENSSESIVEVSELPWL